MVGVLLDRRDRRAVAGVRPDRAGVLVTGWLAENWRLAIKLFCIGAIFAIAVWQLEKERRRKP